MGSAISGFDVLTIDLLSQNYFITITITIMQIKQSNQLDNNKTQNNSS